MGQKRDDFASEFARKFDRFIAPDYFFAFEQDIKKWDGRWNSEKELANLSQLLQGESEAFATVSMAWQESAPKAGLNFFIDVQNANPQVTFPKIEDGDSCELFIDTKNLKSARTTHRFCHHFYFLPERVEGVMAKEVTRFRTEDSHPPAESADLEVQVVRKKKATAMRSSSLRDALLAFSQKKVPT